MDLAAGDTMKWLITVLLALTGSSVLIAEAPADAVLLKARIVQLESQLAALTTEGTVCRAQLAIAQQPQVQQQQAKDRQAIEKDAGCVLDWTANPPVCKPNTPAKEK